MKFISTVLITILFISIGINIKFLYNNHFQTQSEMINYSVNISNNINSDFENICNKIIETYRTDKNFVKSFREDKENFIKYREIQINTVLPLQSNPVSYGSNYAIYYNSYYNDITIQKIKEYKKALKLYCSYNDFAQPEDVCNDKTIDKIFKNY